MPWSNEKIEKQKSYFREQIRNPTGKYTEFVIRTYFRLCELARANSENWCSGKETESYRLKYFAYANAYGGRPDHAGSSIIDKIKDVLTNMGYIEGKEVDNVWRIYILKPLDFLDCEIENYINRTKKEDYFDEVYKYLQKYGIKIFMWEKECWRCKKRTVVYSYYLGNQIKYELNNQYDFRATKVVHSNLSNCFETIGIGSIAKIDKFLMQKFTTIKESYSSTMGMKYPLNICSNCSAIQGINYVVLHPKEIETIAYDELKKRIVAVIFPCDIDLTREDLIENIMKY